MYFSLALSQPLTLFPVAIPLPVRPGWSVCVEGIPTAPIRFTVDLMVGADNRALHADFRFQYSTTPNEIIIMGYKYNGAYLGRVEFTSFPFSVNQPFHLRIKATDTGMYELIVNNTLCASNPHQPILPATAITSVNVNNYISVTHLNLLCSM
ncbi:hypothetical protein V1264_004634 [Littorina saxatilis]|uniref:Galectin n=1 Tax=Littorina saxatilis TaxID=31220 RepID=A0AAN9B2V7_9CAEN